MTDRLAMKRICAGHRLAVYGLAAVRTSLRAYLEVNRDAYHEGLLGLVESLLKSARHFDACACDLCTELREGLNDH